MRRSPVLTSLAALLLAACATAAPAAPDAQALRGCWIEQRGTNAITQRWFPARAGAWQGDELTYLPQGDPDPVRWMLKPGRDGDARWRMCMVERNMMSAPPCWRAYFGSGHADGDDQQWVEIEAAPETLKITYVTAGERMVTYDGARDGCD